MVARIVKRALSTHSPREWPDIRVVNPRKTQLIDALKESYPESQFGQFAMAPDPFWAWVSSVLDPQDSIKELLN